MNAKYSHIPLLLIFTGVVILPVGWMYGSAFWVDGRISLHHYVSAWGDMRQMGLLFRSLAIATGAAGISVLMGVPLALVLTRTDLPGRRILGWLSLAPLCLPPHIHAAAWIGMIGKTGVSAGFTPLLFTSPGVSVVLALAYYPFVLLLTMSGLGSLDQRLEDAAALGYPWYTVWYRVTLPLLGPHIFSGAVFVFIFSLFNYGVPSLLQVNTYPVEIFAQFSAFYNEGAAVALSLPVVMTALILLVIQHRLIRDKTFFTVDTALSRPRCFALGKWRYAAIFAVGLILLLSVFSPLGALMVQAASWKSFGVALSRSGTEIVTTLLFSAMAATLLMICAYPLAAAIHGKKQWTTNAMDGLTFITLGFPAIVVGIGLIRFWNRPVLELVYGTAAMVIMAYGIRFIPFAVKIAQAGFQQIAPGLMESAWLCEPGWWRRFWKIEFPLLKNTFSAVWVLCFILCMSELGVTLLLIPPGMGTISLKIYTLMHYGAANLVAALSLILVGINLIAGCVFVAGATMEDHKKTDR